MQVGGIPEQLLQNFGGGFLCFKDSCRNRRTHTTSASFFGWSIFLYPTMLLLLFLTVYTVGTVGTVGTVPHF